MQDMAIERAAGLMANLLCNGKEEYYALARASESEPELTDSELDKALDWAKASCRCADMCDCSDGTQTLAELMDKAGVPWREGK